MADFASWDVAQRHQHTLKLPASKSIICTSIQPLQLILAKVTKSIILTFKMVVRLLLERLLLATQAKNADDPKGIRRNWYIKLNLQK